MADRRRISIAAAAAALLLIAIGIALAAGSDSDESTPAATEATETGKGPGPGEGEHGEHYSNLYVADVRTRRLRRLTEDQLAVHPAWAPNRRIVFSSSEDDESYAHLFRVDARAQDQALIRAKGVRHLFHPSWSPDGRRLAAAVNGRGIYAIDVRTGATRKLTPGQSDANPAWSPRGDWIVFDKQVAGTNYDLYAVNAATRDVRRVTRDRLQQTNPCWSPDGSKIAFAEQQRSGRWAIVTMRFDGSARRRITRPGTSAQQPSWSPDGSRIAFIAQGLDRAVVAVTRADGAGRPRVLTPRSLSAATPAWSPDGRRIAFTAVDAE